MKTITQQLESIASEICDQICRYTHEPIPEGKDEDWLVEDEDSPCRSCPLNRM